MLIAPLVATSLAVTVATGPMNGSGAANPMRLSVQEKTAATEPLVRSATDCIVRAVVRDPRFTSKAANLGDLIVDRISSCVAPMRAMIDAYDRYYGDGTGEAFFMGPYLDVLPRAVVEGSRETR